MDLELTGKVAWVAGGSGGIGSEIARELATEGCAVALSGRNLERLQQRAAELAAATGRKLIAIVADSADRVQIDAAAARIRAELGGIDILVNCAGTPGGKAAGPLATVDEELFLADLNEKYLGALRYARAAVPVMRARGWGRIINIGGLSARQSGSYSAGGRNAGLTHLTKTLADELGADGITVNVVHPGETRSPWLESMLEQRAGGDSAKAAELEREVARHHAIGRLPDAAEIAHLVTFLASPKAAAITGESIAAGGGPQRAVFY
jgi:NAD(P)-dependent dehydrogenase (short-subunit alcohol dehydrogenase family)